MDINEIILEKVRRVKHVALDMDGTIYNGGTLFPFTIGFLDKMKELGIGYSFLTNNPSRSTNDYLKHLNDMGIKASKDEFYTSAQATIDYLRLYRADCKRLFILGTPSMIKEFEEAGFESTMDDANDEPDAVVVGLICPWYIRACVVLRGGLIRRSFILRLTRTGYVRLINLWCWLIAGLFVQVWSMLPGENRIWLSASLILEC